jgi:general secretion pathway protein A
MYTSFYGFKENPFNLTPDPRYLFLSRYHREALDHLLYGINERKGFIAITGGIGTGKTTLSRALLGQLDGSVKNALVFNSFISDTELLEIVNQEFDIGLDSAIKTKKEYIDKLNQFLLETFSQGGNAVLLIDEAQNLSLTVLEQIRMLSNLETEREKLLQIVLVGQSELKELLANPSLKQLDERITVRYELKPLDRSDVQGYVEHRLVVGGGRGNVKFTDGALKEIYRYSQGNPRRINAVCDRSLLVAYAKDEFSISLGTVKKAIGDMRGAVAPEIGVSFWPKKVLKLLPAVAVLLIALAGFFLWAYKVDVLELVPGKRIAHLSSSDMAPKVSVPVPGTQAPSLFLDEQASLAGLFRLYKEKDNGGQYAGDSVHVGLFPFNTEIETYSKFRKPFRILLDETTGSPGGVSPVTASGSRPSPRYLLIQEMTSDGAMIIDANGQAKPVTREFLQGHQGQRVSWVYPYENRSLTLVKGMSGTPVLEVQQTLEKMGYPVEMTGVFDDLTFQNITKFQALFGLKPDGIVGPRTKALLYQASD